MPHFDNHAGSQTAGPGQYRPAAAPEPGVSVVVPVRARVAQLSATLASLDEAARASPEPVEVLVVDDSAPADARLHRRNCERYGARYLRGPRHVGAKRNLGAAQAHYDLLFFTDSDCRPATDAIVRHVRRLRAAPSNVAAVAGPTLVEESNSALFRVMRESHLLNGDLERPSRDERLPWATTSNLAVRRSIFETVGGFTERSLTVVGGEDVDLGLRLTGRGYAILSEPAAIVTHDRASTASLPVVVRRLFEYGRSEQWLAERYPQHCRPRWNPVSALALATVAAAIVRNRRCLLALPVTAVALLAVDAWRHRSERSTQGYTEAIARRLVEWSFDVGAVTAAVQLRRPRLLFAGFAVPTPDTDLAH